MPVPLARSTRRRLAGAVTTVLAVTLGATAPTAPAYAAPFEGGVLAADAATTADPIAYPKAGRLVGAGVTGFLTTSSAGVTSFRRYSDGGGQGYDGDVYLRSTPTTDFLVFRGSYKITQRNLATNGSLEVPVGSLTGDAKWAGAAADAVFTTVATEAGTALRKHVDGAPTVTVTGLPADAAAVMVTPATPAHAKVAFRQNGLGKWGLLDLATGVLALGAPGIGTQAVSATHTAWSAGSATDQGPRVFVADRATGAVQEAPVPPEPSLGNLQVGLVGDWVLYGQKGGMGFVQPSVHHAITAYNVTTRATVKVLDHAYEFTSAPDGSLYARGGLVGRGEGMYRIAATGGDILKAEPVATTGEPTEVVATDSTVPPAVLDLDRADGFTFRWTLSREVRNPKLTVRHVRTGKTHTLSWQPTTSAPVFAWVDSSRDEDVPNGDFTWELTGEPVNGIGPAVTAKGTFKVVRKAQPHDFNDNGSPDLFSRDSAGRLWRTDLFYRPIDERRGINEASARTYIGAGWGVYDRIEAAGNLGGTPVGDLLARDRSGVLWLHQGNGAGSFAARVQVGGGWQIYDKITSGGDLTNDGRVDALAADGSGVLWLHPGSGSATKPFLPRKKIGAGWGIYNDITAVGNIAGGPAGDLVARDKDGVLWLHLGKGDGTFAPRTRIGGGWNAFRPLIAAGDADGDGRPDLMGLGATFQSPSLYKSTGDWKVPFRTGEVMYLEQVDANTSDLVF
ncbi:VCBS repeat-containing protein [Streptomyces sp. NBC_00233]|uniref:VCBS repeat-containing protein n=1 Tax=Streptomyces sp. NBC_00233 TaxID=2975686 RepID=UPI002253AF00|nr:VCBS repeat-containing protein [Streptomyces sp. NBC_00233]MCX5227166.1 VCBS repeat-containing protein [Streptomyces sp. NBC_00233]